MWRLSSILPTRFCAVKWKALHIVARAARSTQHIACADLKCSTMKWEFRHTEPSLAAPSAASVSCVRSRLGLFHSRSAGPPEILTYIERVGTRPTECHSMLHADFALFNVDHLVTVAPRCHPAAEGDLGVIEGGALAARDGKIVWVGPMDSLHDEVRLTEDATVVNTHGRTVLPGFV